MKAEFKDGKFDKIIESLQPPRANRFIPRNVASKVKVRKEKDEFGNDVSKNDNPKKIQFGNEKNVTLYFTQD